MPEHGVPSPFGNQPPGTVVLPCGRTQVKKHWIEVQLLDEQEKPVAGEPYRVQLVDGTLHEGTLDEEGLVRFDGIDQGICNVWWPNLQGLVTPPPQEASLPSRAGSAEQDIATDADPDHWIEIQLLDEAGSPIDAERYELRLPDGSLERGILDENGTVFVAGITAGLCQFSFPDLHAGEWKEDAGV